jgi:hypothetical protein
MTTGRVFVTSEFNCTMLDVVSSREEWGIFSNGGDLFFEQTV